MILTPDGRPDKYAEIERERRYLLRELAASLAGSPDFVRIVDRYLPESALRLRRMETPEGAPVSLKLARKWRTPELAPEETIITNLYLAVEEYEMIARLPAATLQKRRYPLVHGGTRFSVDVFEGVLDGLILAETHLFPGRAAVAGCPLPGCVREVTAELAFSGGRLARLSPVEARAWLETMLAHKQESRR